MIERGAITPRTPSASQPALPGRPTSARSPSWASPSASPLV